MEELSLDRTKMSEEEEYKAVNGDLGQAEGLIDRKRNFKK